MAKWICHPEDQKDNDIVFDKLEDGVSVADWIYAAINGDVQSHGLALLEK